MTLVLKADLDAIATLAAELWISATTIRDIDVNSAFAGVLLGLKGSDVAAACRTAELQIESALASVANRVEAMADANAHAAHTVGITDAQYGDTISGLLKL